MLAQDNHANEKKLENRNLAEYENIQTTFNERFARAQKVLEGWQRGRDAGFERAEMRAETLAEMLGQRRGDKFKDKC